MSAPADVIALEQKLAQASALVGEVERSLKGLVEDEIAERFRAQGYRVRIDIGDMNHYLKTLRGFRR